MFLLKTAGTTSAHVSTYLTVFIVFLVAYAFTNWSNEYFALIITGAYVGLHEVPWFPLYFAFYAAVAPFVQIIADLAFFSALIVAIYFTWKTYWFKGLTKTILVTLIATLIFDYGIWLALGFHITSNAAVPTIWNADLGTNLLEDGGWFVNFVIFMIGLILARKEILKFKEKYKMLSWVMAPVRQSPNLK